MCLVHYMPPPSPVSLSFSMFCSAKCIDHYTQLRVSHFDGSLPEGEDIDIRLELIVNRMFERCLNDRRYKQAVGIAFETRRIDVLQRAIHESVGNLLHPATSFVSSYSLSLSLFPPYPSLSPSPSSTSLSHTHTHTHTNREIFLGCCHTVSKFLSHLSVALDLGTR